MKLSAFIGSLPTLWLLGCSAAGVDGTETAPDTRLVRGSVSSTFGVTTAEECKPLGFPMTMFLTDAFGPGALVEDDATSTSATDCQHEQMVAADADSWAALAYNGVCRGGDDSSLCGAQTTRLCSVETMLHWAEQSAGGFTAVDPIFHFNYVVLPLSERSLEAFYLRILKEAQTLLTESASVLREHAKGTRDCPDEDYEKIAATYAEGLRPYMRRSSSP